MNTKTYIIQIQHAYRCYDEESHPFIENFIVSADIKTVVSEAYAKVQEYDDCTFSLHSEISDEEDNEISDDEFLEPIKKIDFKKYGVEYDTILGCLSISEVDNWIQSITDIDCLTKFFQQTGDRDCILRSLATKMANSLDIGI